MVARVGRKEKKLWEAIKQNTHQGWAIDTREEILTQVAHGVDRKPVQRS
jgi:hypothetical protein